MIMMNTKINLNFPKFKFQDDLRNVATQIVIPILAENIDNQVSLDETPFPALEVSTIKRKEKLGQSKTLIASGELQSSFISKDKGSNSVVVTINSQRKTIAGYLQLTGVGKKKKTFNFFGVSTRMEDSAMNYMNNSIKEKINARGSR